MATYTISTAVTTAGTAQTINTGDTVTVTSSGSLNGTGTAGYGIYANTSGGASGGFDTIDVSGTVRGGDYGFWDAGSGGNDTVTVNAGGSIFGGAASAGSGGAIYIEAGSNTITNGGQIIDNLSAYGIYLNAGGNTITNTGTISTAGYDTVYVDGGYNTIDNSGVISGASADYAFDLAGTAPDAGHNVITNSGTITGYYAIEATGGSNSVSNSGNISCDYYGAYLTGSHNSVTNTGSIVASGYSAVDLDGSYSTLTNSGLIAGGSTEYAVYTDGSHNVLVNKTAGAISGGTYGIYGLGASTVVKNAGVVSGGEYGMYLYDVTGAHIKVTGSGSVISGTGTGIYAYGAHTGGLHYISDVHINVKGLVQGGDTGIEMYYDNNVVKVGAHGSVIGVSDTGIINYQGNNTHIFNAGTIQGRGDEGIFLETDSGAHIHNNGTITGADSGIYIESGDSAHITNNGLIAGGTYDGIYLSGASNVVTNKSDGIIKLSAAQHGGSGYGALVFSDGYDTVTNSGKIVVGINGLTDIAAVGAGSGHNVITNNAGGLISDFHGGQTSNFAVQLEDGSNVVTNSGKIVGTVQIGSSGTNTYDGSGGHLKGTVMGGTGNDTIVLGGGHSSVIGGSGADSITIGTGEDNVIYTAVTDSDITTYDTVDGFTAGTDTFTFDLNHNALNGLASVTVSSLAAVDVSHISAAVAGYLDPYGAVALSVSSGLYAGDVFLIVDHSGTSSFSAANDYFVALTHLSGTLSASDILTT